MVDGDYMARVELLRECRRHGALAEAKLAQSILAQCGMLDTLLANHLIGVYGSCGSVSCARRIFKAMHVRNLFSWTAMIGADAQAGDYAAALWRLERMLELGVRPDGVVFVVLLGHCRGPEALATGKAVHGLIVREGLLEREIVVGNALLGMYDRCGDVSQAMRVFRAMPDRNTITWTSIIGAVSRGQEDRRLWEELFHAMLLEGIKVDKVAFATALTACRDHNFLCSSRSASSLIALHRLIVEAGLEMDEIVGAALADAYGRCGELEVARNLLLKFLDYHSTSALHWTAVLEAFSQRGRTGEAVELFWRMQLEGVKSDDISLVAFANACSDVKSLKLAQELLEEAGVKSVTKSANVLIVMYSRCGCLDEARKIFDGMLVRDIVSWNSIISAYVLHQEPYKALELYGKMDLEPAAVTFSLVLDACGDLGDLKAGQDVHERIRNSGFSIENDPVVGTSLLTFYGKCRELKEAVRIFRGLSSRGEGLPWSCLAQSYAQHGHVDESSKLFSEMLLEGIKPSKAALIVAIESCQSPTQGRTVHAVAEEKGLGNYDAGIGNSLVNLYAKFGDVNGAVRVFRSMGNLDVVSWNSLLACLATTEGGGDLCLALFRSMQLQGQEPSQVTFIAVLSSCSHGGLFQQAREFFLSMQQDFGVAPTLRHFGCLVDLLGRKGRLGEAEELARQMPVAPGAVLWTAFLGACASHDDLHRAERAVDNVLAIDNDGYTASALAALSNVHSRMG